MTYNPDKQQFYANLGYVVHEISKLAHVQYVRVGTEDGFLGQEIVTIKVVGVRAGNSFDFGQKIPELQLTQLTDPTILVDYMKNGYNAAMKGLKAR